MSLGGIFLIYLKKATIIGLSLSVGSAALISAEILPSLGIPLNTFIIFLASALGAGFKVSRMLGDKGVLIERKK